MLGEVVEVAGVDGHAVTLEQVQDSPPIEIDLDVAIRPADHEIVTRRAALRGRGGTFHRPLPAGAEGVGLDPGGTGLFRPAR